MADEVLPCALGCAVTALYVFSPELNLDLWVFAELFDAVPVGKDCLFV
jgi:hypothetical protein